MGVIPPAADTFILHEEVPVAQDWTFGSPEPEAAAEEDSLAGFARDLRVLRANAGLDYPDMAKVTHYTMRTVASTADGLRFPTLPVLLA